MRLGKGKAFPLAIGRSIGKLSPMSDCTAHSRDCGLTPSRLRLAGAFVRLIELQGPACGRFMR